MRLSVSTQSTHAIAYRTPPIVTITHPHPIIESEHIVIDESSSSQFDHRIPGNTKNQKMAHWKTVTTHPKTAHQKQCLCEPRNKMWSDNQTDKNQIPNATISSPRWMTTEKKPIVGISSRTPTRSGVATHWVAVTVTPNTCLARRLPIPTSNAAS